MKTLYVNGKLTSLGIIRMRMEYLQIFYILPLTRVLIGAIQERFSKLQQERICDKKLRTLIKSMVV